jgi:hypothetical protein
MGSITRTPQIFGSIQPAAGVLTLLAVMVVGQNAYGSVFVANVNDLITDKARIAVKNQDAVLDLSQYLLYDTEVEPNFSIQLANIGLNSGDQIWGYSENGFITFNMTGEKITSTP